MSIIVGFNTNMRYITLFLILVVFSIAKAQKSNTDFKMYSSGQIAEIVPNPGQFNPVTIVKDLFLTQSLPEDMRKDYILNAEKYLGQVWRIIPDSIFSEYKTMGNRINYERMYFASRRQLACLAMGEIVERKGRFLQDIVNGLNYLKKEIWWGIPAHYPLSFPRPDLQVVDLYNAETASLVAWTIYMLNNELDTYSPGLCKSLRNEVKRRILTPCRTNNYSWKNYPNNWNTWICENWLSCVIFCETDSRHQVEAIQQIANSLYNFYIKYPDDGGCDEGITYWDRAAASFFQCINMLDILTSGKISLKDDKKLKAMGAFAYKTYIGNGLHVNFADASVNTQSNINVLFPFGKYVNDSTMMAYAAMIAQKGGFNFRPSLFFNSSGNFPSLSRELLYLAHYHEYKNIKPEEPLLQDVWLPDLQVLIARSRAGTSQGYCLAVKGGHNGESHNHNDVGNFIVYHNSVPVVVDIGAGTYTAKTFSASRYELFNCRSAYHNVPCINGFDQQEGNLFKADGLKYHQDKHEASLFLDIAGAYPNEAQVKKWHRTVSLNRVEGVKILEYYELSKYVSPTEIVLVCCGQTVNEADGRIVIYNGEARHDIIYDKELLSPTIERIDITDPLIVNSWKGLPLYRIRLTVKSQALKGKIEYKIK